MSSATNARDGRLQAVIAAFLEAAGAGPVPDREQLLATHPDLADDLRAFFADHDGMTEAAAAVRDKLVSDGKAAAEAPAKLPADSFPQAFGDYELLEEIGRGGMGVVYKARQITLDRIVALKRIRAGQLASTEEVARFRREAKAAAGLDHPNIVPIYEVGECQGQQYFTMKLIEGGNLGGHLDRFADARACAELMVQTARAVHHAHQRGVLHRDVKPSNILIDATGQPHVSDFGLAQHLEKEAKLTQSGAIVGTAEYMAPEQARGEKGLTTAADVYGLGAVLYVLLTGHPPFQGDYTWETLKKVVEEEPPMPRSLNRKANRDLETICVKCLAKEPARRYGSAEALADDLQRWLDGTPIEARRAGMSERLWKWARRRPARAGLLAAVAALLVFGVVLFQQSRDLDYQVMLADTRQSALDAQEKLARERGKLAREREWFLLLHQARAERLRGNRQQALAHLKKLAELTSQADTPGEPALLHEEAFLAINTTAATLLRELPFGTVRPFDPDPAGLSLDGTRILVSQHDSTDLRLSPDGSKLLVRGTPFGQKMEGIWYVPLGSGAPVAHAASLGKPDSRLSARWSEDGKHVRIDAPPDGQYLWDPVANLSVKQGKPSLLLVSPQGGWQADWEKGVYWRTGDRVEGKGPDPKPEWKAQPRKIPGTIRMFLSETQALAQKQGPVQALLVWDLEKNEPVAERPCSSWKEIAPGRLLCWDDKEILLWDPAKNRKLLGFPENSRIISRMEHRLLVAVEPKEKQGVLQTWDLNRCELLGEIPVPPELKGQIGSYEWDGRWLVGYRGDREGRRSALRAYDLRTGESCSLGDHQFMSFLPASGLFMTGAFRHPSGTRDLASLQLWDIENQKQLAILPNPDLASTDKTPDGRSDPSYPSLIQSLDGRVVAISCSVRARGSCSEARGIRAWEIAHPNPSYPGMRPVNTKLRDPEAAAHGWEFSVIACRLEFSSDGRRLAVNDELWEVARGGDLAFLQPSLRMETKNSPLIFLGREGQVWELHPPSGDRGVRIVSRQPAGKEWELPAESEEWTTATQAFPTFAVSPTGKYALQANRFFVKVWDLSGDRPTLVWFHQYQALPSSTRSFIFFRPVFTSDDAFEVRRGNTRFHFYIPSRRREESKDENTWTFPLSRSVEKVSNGQVFFADGRPRVRLEGGLPEWNTDFGDGPPRPLVLSPDGRFLALQPWGQPAGAGDLLHLWDAQTGQLLLRWKAHDHEIAALAFSPEGSLLATGDQRSVKLWNIDYILRERESLGLPRSWPTP